MREMYFIAILLFVIIHAGYAIGNVKSIFFARIMAWSLVLVSAVVAHFITLEISPILRMLAIITTTLFGMKAIVLVEAYRGNVKLNYLQWLAFSAGWFGMRPQIFERLVSSPLDDKVRLLIKGLTRILIGLLLLFLVTFLYFELYPPSLHNEIWWFLKDSVGIIVKLLFTFLAACSYYFGIEITTIINVLALVGISFILHFGILNLSTSIWRFLGVDAKELFRSPALSMSLKEFWGKRWNLAFSEMTALVVYRPLKDRLGKNTAVFMAFLFSGILHEMAISVPVNSGYGLPLLYFLIHGLLMLAEDKIEFIRKINHHRVFARVWVMCWLLLPMPLLFHKEFIGKIVLPIVWQITLP